MAVTLQEIYAALGDRFQLKLIAGANAISPVVTWVHMMEDTNVVDFFFGNEIVVTSCFTAHDPYSLLKTLETLEKKRCAGVVINVGKYIDKVPKEVIQYCNEMMLPLFTMPWHMSMTEFVRASCYLISQGAQSEEAMARAVMNAVNTPQDPGGYHRELSEYFDESRGFRMLAIRIKVPAQTNTEEIIMDQRSKLRFHSALQHLSVPYLLFREGQRYFALLNTQNEADARKSAENILDRIKSRIPNATIQVGIGDSVNTLSTLDDAFHSALSAQRSARMQGIDLEEFSKMGFFRLIYSVPNDDMLRSFYVDTMHDLQNYDEQHNTNFCETLFRYLLTDGSLTEVANQMYTHRNTINYRMGKIREILHCELATAQEKFPYLFAYYVGMVLKLVDKLDDMS